MSMWNQSRYYLELKNYQNLFHLIKYIVLRLLNNLVTNEFKGLRHEFLDEELSIEQC